MDHGTLALLIPITAIIGGLFIAYVGIVTKNKEKLAMIEKGGDFDLTINEKSSSRKAFRNGLMFIGLGLGLFIGYMLQNSMEPDFEFPVYILSMTLIFGGAGLLAAHLLEIKKLEEEQNKD